MKIYLVTFTDKWQVDFLAQEAYFSKEKADARAIELTAQEIRKRRELQDSKPLSGCGGSYLLNQETGDRIQIEPPTKPDNESVNDYENYFYVVHELDIMDAE